MACCFFPVQNMNASSTSAVFRQIAANWKSGLTVALVSVPLSLSLAIASGATPVMGIITAIWAGLVAAIFGGSDFNVIGPAGALSGILASFALTNGAQMLPVLAILSGIMIFGFYLLKWDKYLIFIPSSVMHGFTLGVGLTIGLGQMNFALGLKGLPVHETLLQNFLESLRHAAEMDAYTVALFTATLCLLFLIARFFSRIPGAVIAAIIGITIGYCSETHLLPFALQTIVSKYGTLQATLIQIPAFAFPAINMVLIKAVFTVTIVAVLETLLSAKIVDGMTNTRFNQRREVFGLALANIASGFTGGLPATGVLARTALNAKSGATSRYSSGINTVLVALIALLLFRGFQYLPLAVVAAILVFAAIRMVETAHFKKLFHFDQSSFWLAMLVAILTFAVDPMIGILVGASVSLLEFVQHLSVGRSDITLHRDGTMIARSSHKDLHKEEDHGDVTVYRFAGELTYFNASSHEETIKRLKCTTLILSLRNLFYLDVDGLEALHAIIRDRERHGIDVILSAVSSYKEAILRKTDWYPAMVKEKKVFPSTTDALTNLGFPMR